MIKKRSPKSHLMTVTTRFHIFQPLFIICFLMNSINETSLYYILVTLYESYDYDNMEVEGVDIDAVSGEIK